MSSDTIGSLLDAMGHLVGTMGKVVRADAKNATSLDHRDVAVKDRAALIDYIKARKPCEFCRRELDLTGKSCAGCYNRSLWEAWDAYPVPSDPLVKGGIHARDWRAPVQ